MFLYPSGTMYLLLKQWPTIKGHIHFPKAHTQIIHALLGINAYLCSLIKILGWILWPPAVSHLPEIYKMSVYTCLKCHCYLGKPSYTQ